MKVTIKDIAERCATSPATVSRVLSGSDYPVREDLKNRIMSTALELNYRPNIFGRRLRGIESREVGVIIPNLSNPFYGELLDSLEATCYDLHFKPTIRCSHNRQELESQHFQDFQESRVCGILISSIHNHQDVLKNAEGEANLPVVFFDQGQTNPEDRSMRVTYDFRKAGFLSASHLLETGHRSLAYVLPSFDRPSRKQICRGIHVATLRHPAVDYRIISLEDDTPIDLLNIRSVSEKLAQKVLKQIRELDGLIVLNDILAIGIMTELRASGIRVPEDISVISHDDLWLAEMVSPRLTTVRQSAAETGKAAVRLLHRHLAQSLEERTTVLIPELVVRETVQNRYYRDKQPIRKGVMR